MTPDSDAPGGTVPAHDVIAAIYRSLLGRSPDADGSRYWEGVLLDSVAAGQTAEATIAEVITAFVTTEEGHRRLVASLSADPAASGDIRRGAAQRALVREEFLQPENGLRLRGVIPLGANCYPASLLDRFGARSWSGPFDWVFSTPAMVRDCLADGFAEFLDPTHYREVPLSERADPDYNRVSHQLFERRYGIEAPIFNHTDAHTPDGQAYLRRCVDRLNDALSRGETLRFLHVDKPAGHTGTEFNRMLDALRGRTATPRLVQVAVEEPVPGHPVAETIAAAPDGRLLRFRPSSRWSPTRFADPLDDLVLMRAIRDAFDALD